MDTDFGLNRFGLILITSGARRTESHDDGIVAVENVLQRYFNSLLGACTLVAIIGFGLSILMAPFWPAGRRPFSRRPSLDQTSNVQLVILFRRDISP